jgi:hypothetical protein
VDGCAAHNSVGNGLNGHINLIIAATRGERLVPSLGASDNGIRQLKRPDKSLRRARRRKGVELAATDGLIAALE